ncbi:MAG: four helix bundle protein [Chloroflexota bacterium]|nr:four helix bundle protein [Chloroflexota bacterium]
MALDFQEALFEVNARRSEQRLPYLHNADANLNKRWLYLRLSYQWNWLNAGQYQHVTTSRSKMIEEIGRLLGGWLKLNSKDLSTLNVPPHLT